MKQFLLILFLSGLQFASIAQKNDDSFFANADAFFRKYVWDGKVYYQQISKNRQQLDSLVKQIAFFKIDRSNAYKTRSFYINAYNILVIKSVINHYPISSVKDVQGFFDNYKFNVAGKRLSLNQIQTNLIIRNDKLPDVLFSLSNGSVSGPPIYNVAISANKQLKIDIENRINSFTNNTVNVSVNDENKTVILSHLFKWYKESIILKYQTEIAFINKSRKEKIPDDYIVIYADYDWSLIDINGKTVSKFTSMQAVECIPAKPVALTNDFKNELKLINTGLVLKPEMDLNTKIYFNRNFFDEELGFKNESRFIESKTYEFRLSDKFYTQKDYFNKRMLRTASDHRTTYNSIMIEGSYAFSRRLESGILLNEYRNYNDKFPAKAIDFFSAPDNKKSEVIELQFYSKYKWYEKKYRFSTFAYLTLPVVNKRINDKVVNSNKYYDVGLTCYYDGYPTSFIRMILSAEFVSHYSITREKTTFEFNPESSFIFTLYRSKLVNFSALMELQFSANENKTAPFTTIESLAMSIRILHNLDCNLMYQYSALGKSTGAGQAINLGLVYAVN